MISVDDDGAQASTRTPLPDEVTQPIGRDGDTPVYNAQVPVTPSANESPAQQTGPHPTEDPSDRVPSHPSHYHDQADAELSPGESYDRPGLWEFYTKAHAEKWRPSQVQASRRYLRQGLSYLRTALQSGEGVQSILEHLNEGYALHMAHAKATDEQITMGWTMGVQWLQKNWGRLFGSQPDAAKAFVQEKPTGITSEMHEIVGKINSSTTESERKKWQARWDALFHHGGRRDYVQDT